MTTTDTPTRSKQVTWRDPPWSPVGAPEPDELMTRDELIEALNREGLGVSVGDLRNWQSAGVVPYAVKRWTGDATRGVYPGWMVDVVRDLRRLQGEGYKLRQIGPLLRTNERLRRAYAESTPLSGSERWAATNRPADLADIGPRLRAVAQSHELRTGTRICRVEAVLELDGDDPRLLIRLHDDRGHPLTFDLSE